MKSVKWIPAVLLFVFQTSQSSQNIFQNIISPEAMGNYGQALEAIFGVGIRLNAFLDESTTPNFVVSPISATVLVSQLLLGAEGDFQQQLFDLLSLPGYSQNYTVYYYNRNRKNSSCTVPYADIQLQLSSLIKQLDKREPGEQFTLKQSSALFYNKDIQLKKCFRRNLVQFYSSDVIPLDFNIDTSRTINDWGSLQTNGLITAILSTPPGPSTSSIFLNSIYFLAKWRTPFSDMLNVDDPFNVNENTQVTTTYMQGFIEEILYGETKDYRIICLPYRNNELGMYILLPNANNTYKYNSKEFIRHLNPAEVLATISKASKRDVVVKIPKLSLSNHLRLLEPLQKYAQFKKNAKQTKGVVDSNDVSSIINRIGDNVNNYKNFTPTAVPDIYLTAAAHNRSLLVSDIIQEVVFSINEEGTQAAAISAGITDYMGGSKTMVLNRPFSFFIRHEPTLATLFWGSITDPSRS